MRAFLHVYSEAAHAATRPLCAGRVIVPVFVLFYFSVCRGYDSFQRFVGYRDPVCVFAVWLLVILRRKYVDVFVVVFVHFKRKP